MPPPLKEQDESLTDDLFRNVREGFNSIFKTVVEQGQREVREKLGDPAFQDLNQGAASEDSDLTTREVRSNERFFGLTRDEAVVLGGGTAVLVLGLVVIALVSRR